MTRNPPKPSTDFNSGAGALVLNKIKSDARTAMVNGDDVAALEAIRAFENLVPASNDIRRRVYNSMMDDAINYGSKGSIDYLLGKSQTGYASGLARTAHIDQIDSFRHLLAHAAAAGEKIASIDLETTLVMAAEHSSQTVMKALLDMGVTPHIHDDRPLKVAVEKYQRGGFEPIETLLRHGAGFKTAQGFAAGNKELLGEIAALQHEMKAQKVKDFSIIGKGAGRDLVAPSRATFRPKALRIP